MRNEILDFYKKISESELKIYSQEIDFKSIIQNMQKVPLRDRPDGILPIGDTVYILEHFEISIFKNTRKGDAFKSVEKLPKEKIINDINFFPKKDNLVKNLEKALKKHSKSFDAYFKEAEQLYPNKKYMLIMLIEDNSNDILANANDEDINILSIYETIMEILLYIKIDGVINYNTSPRGNYTTAKDKGMLKALMFDKIGEICELLTPIQREALSDSIKSLIGVEENIQLSEVIEVFKQE